VAPGARFAYRLRMEGPDGAIVTAGEWIDIPGAPRLAVRVRPHPATRPWRVELTVPRADAATLEVFDTAGRRLGTRRLPRVAAGRTSLDATALAPLAPGVYLLRLTQGADVVTTRFCVVR
jgi:hypothetical protein